MYPTEPEVPKKSRRLLWIGITIAAITAFVVIATVVVFNNSKKEEAVSSNSTSAETQDAAIATNEDVKQNLSELDATLKQATTDQAAAKAALKDGTNQIKVAN